MLTCRAHNQYEGERVFGKNTWSAAGWPALQLPPEAANRRATHLYDGDQWFPPANIYLLPVDQSGVAGREYSTDGFTVGQSYQTIQAWDPPLDASCLATHAEPDICNDRCWRASC